MEFNFEIILGKHADDKRISNGLTKDDIKRVIKLGGKIKEKDGYKASYTYIEVAYKEIKPNLYFVKTVYINRR